jgi:chemotaxis response regulator CheB
MEPSRRRLDDDMRASCVVYGMPKAANALGATEVEAAIGRIAGMILERCAG